MPNNQIKASGLVSGSTYYLVINNQTAQYYYTVTPAFENYNSAHWASYANASGTANTAGDWFGTFPALAAGVYEVSLRLRAGGSAVISDTVLGGNTVYWDGTNIAPTANVTELNGFSDRAANLASAFISAVSGVAAVGSLSLNALNLPPNDATCTITDALATVAVFRFKTTNPGTDIWINTSSANVATIIGLWVAAINSNLNMTATNASPNITLVDLTTGTAGNVSITTTDSGSITVVGMRNGVNAVTAGQLIRVNGSNYLETDSVSGGAAGLTGTCQAGSTSTTIKLALSADSADNYYLNQVISTTGGTGPNQARTITGYVGLTRVATVDAAWVTTPDATTTYLLPGVNPVSQINVTPAGSIIVTPS